MTAEGPGGKCFITRAYVRGGHCCALAPSVMIVEVPCARTRPFVRLRRNDRAARVDGLASARCPS